MAVLVGTKSKEIPISIIFLITNRASHTIDLCKVVPAVPGEVGGEKFHTLVDSTQASKFRSVGVQDDLIGPSLFDPNPVIRETFLLRPKPSQSEISSIEIETADSLPWGGN